RQGLKQQTSLVAEGVIQTCTRDPKVIGKVVDGCGHVALLHKELHRLAYHCRPIKLRGSSHNFMESQEARYGKGKRVHETPFASQFESLFRPQSYLRCSGS